MISDAMKVRLRPGDRGVLEARLRAATTEQRQLLRIRIVLEAAEGHGTREIARELETTPTTVSLWRIRYAHEGLDGLEDRLRSGTPPIYGEATDQRIRKVLDQRPPKGFARWNGPSIARALGDVDVQYVWRSLRKQKIDLAGRKSWCESNDPDFAAKAADVVGLYMAPPKNAIVLCVDEKPSIQALGAGLFEIAERTRPDRAQPRLQTAWHNNLVCRLRGRHRQGQGRPQETPPPQGISRLHG